MLKSSIKAPNFMLEKKLRPTGKMAPREYNLFSLHNSGHILGTISLIEPIACPSIPPSNFQNQSILDKLGNGCTYHIHSVSDSPFWQPPFHNALKGILSIRMLFQIRKDFASDFRFLQGSPLSHDRLKNVTQRLCHSVFAGLAHLWEFCK